VSPASRVLDDGSLLIRSHLVIPSEEIQLRVTTSGGPGGQHANRSLTRVVASFDVVGSRALSESDRDRLLEKCGDVIRASVGQHRSQGRNRADALEHLADKIVEGLARRPARRATRPTRASQVRRVDEKKLRSRTKLQRRVRDDD
jgi:ribosome-associated protein